MIENLFILLTGGLLGTIGTIGILAACQGFRDYDGEDDDYERGFKDGACGIEQTERRKDTL